MATKKRSRYYLLLALAWLGLIGFVSLQPKPPGVDTLQHIAAWFPFPKAAMCFLQAIIHAVLFGVWAILCAMVVVSAMSPVSVRKVFFFPLAAVVVVGVAVEIAQIWIPNRAPDLTDFAGDFVGALLFLVLSWRMSFGPFHLSSLNT